MKTISIHDAKSNLSKYIEAAKKGNKIYIGGYGKAEVVLTKLSTEESNLIGKHNFSISKGKVKEKTDSFSRATDNQVSSLLYGN
jgi:antitoxin (DNA-binding transcriptional repressor) of toxin-antitoxin stability system